MYPGIKVAGDGGDIGKVIGYLRTLRAIREEGTCDIEDYEQAEGAGDALCGMEAEDIIERLNGHTLDVVAVEIGMENSK